MKKRYILGLAGLVAGALLSANSIVQPESDKNSQEETENVVSVRLEDKYLDGFLLAIERAELTNFRNVWMRTKHNPRGNLASTAFGPQQITESLVDSYYRQGKISIDDYSTLKLIYRRMDSKLKKKNPSLHIDYGETVRLTQEQKQAYYRVSRIMIHDILERHNYDLERSLLDWRFGKNSRKTIRHDPRYFKVANATLSELGLL